MFSLFGLVVVWLFIVLYFCVFRMDISFGGFWRFGGLVNGVVIRFACCVAIGYVNLLVVI